MSDDLHREPIVNWTPLDDDPDAWFKTYAYVAAVCYPYDGLSDSNLDRVGPYEVWLYRLGKIGPHATDPYEEPF